MASRIGDDGGEEGEVVFTRGGYANEAVNNDGFLLFSSRSLYSFFPRMRIAWVGSLKKEQKERERRTFIPGNYDGPLRGPFTRDARASVVTVFLTNTRFLSEGRLGERTIDIHSRDAIICT